MIWQAASEVQPARDGELYTQQSSPSGTQVRRLARVRPCSTAPRAALYGLRLFYRLLQLRLSRVRPCPTGLGAVLYCLRLFCRLLQLHTLVLLYYLLFMAVLNSLLLLRSLLQVRPCPS